MRGHPTDVPVQRICGTRVEESNKTAMAMVLYYNRHAACNAK